jgi:rod shape-determining protein MreC
LIFAGVSSYLAGFIKYDNKEIMMYTDVILDNQKMKLELNAIREIDDLEGKVSKVILRDFYSFYSEIVIDVGEEEKVKINDVVINEEGLVGIVYEVHRETSQVKLLSADYNISVRVGDTYGNFNNGIVSMVDKNSNISIGDLVYTSGLDDVLGDVFVGVVTDISEDSDNLGKILCVDFVDNTNLNYVVVKGKI